MVLRLRGDFDLAGIETFDRALEQTAIAQARRLVIDLRGLEFIDSSGVCAVMRARRQVRDPSRLVLVRGPDSVHRVFEYCGLARMLAFVDDHQDVG